MHNMHTHTHTHACTNTHTQTVQGNSTPSPERHSKVWTPAECPAVSMSIRLCNTQTLRDLMYVQGVCLFVCPQLIPLLSHPNDAISCEVLAFLRVLLYSGNRTVQEGLWYLQETREEGLFATLQKRLEQAAVHFREKWVLERGFRTCS